jgi:hypothetical protein
MVAEDKKVDNPVVLVVVAVTETVVVEVVVVSAGKEMVVDSVLVFQDKDVMVAAAEVKTVAAAVQTITQILQDQVVPDKLG